jgi:hypothetical protein
MDKSPFIELVPKHPRLSAMLTDLNYSLKLPHIITYYHTLLPNHPSVLHRGFKDKVPTIMCISSSKQPFWGNKASCTQGTFFCSSPKCYLD